LPEQARGELEAFDLASGHPGHVPGAIDLFLGEFRVRMRLMLLRRELRRAGVDVSLVHDVVALAAERAAIARRLAHMQRMKHLFELWHVFHRPLVYALFLIVIVHVGIALYFGYARLA
jgi:hypothetical protein